MGSLEKNLRAHGYTPGQVEAGDYCADDATVLLGEYIIESRRLRAERNSARSDLSAAIEACEYERGLRRVARAENERLLAAFHFAWGRRPLLGKQWDGESDPLALTLAAMEDADRVGQDGER